MPIRRTLGLLACAALMPNDAAAQPPPSFSAPCRALREAIAKLDRQGEELVTIQVEGVARRVHFDGALAYFQLCAPPDPQVLCVTYGTGDRKAGDTVTVTGTFTQRDPDLCCSTRACRTRPASSASACARPWSAA